MTSSGPAIRRITLHRVKIPLRQIYVSAMYLMSHVLRTVIEVETEDGCVGIGEAPGTEEVFNLAAQIGRTFLGHNPLERVRLQHAFASSVFNNRNGRNGWSAYGGLELALWDWAGQHFAVPVGHLIGDRHREWVDVVCPVPAVILDGVRDHGEIAALFRERERIDAVVDYCRGQRERYGFRCFKYKSAGLDANWDVELMTALRRMLGPDVALRWDPNAAYSVAQATTLCGRLEDLGLEFYEDPTDDISGMATLRSHVRTPLATNMCVVQLDHLASAIRRRPADVLLVDVYMWGGVENYLTMAAAAKAYDFEVAVHSLFETGIGTAANLQLAASLSQITRANDCGIHVLGRDIVEPGTLAIEHGRMRVPDGHGWGVRIDAAALAEQSVAKMEIHRSAAS